MARIKRLRNVSTITKAPEKGAVRVEPYARRQEAASRGVEKIAVDELNIDAETAVRTLMAEVDRLKRELVHSQQKVEELEFIADEDPLVPVLNRRAFDRELNRALAYARRYEIVASFLYLDLNNFKQVNDQFGHAAGDEVLKFVGQVLGDNVRSSDVVGRLGGDEFGVILVQADEAVAVMKAADLMSRISAEPVVHAGEKIFVDVSIGIAVFAGDDDVDSLVSRADKAMYELKNNSRIAQV